MRIGSATLPAVPRATSEVAASRTATSMSDIRAALGRALEASTGRPAQGRTLDLLAAQVSLETGHGSAMFNFNFGGIKGASPQGLTATYATHEVIDGQSVTLQQGFRAYDSLDAGARDYVSVLRSRFPGAFSQAVAGSVGGFASALKAAHYYTADEAEYTRGLQAAVGGSTPGGVEQTPPGLSTSAELSRVIDAISASAARIADPDPVDG